MKQSYVALLFAITFVMIGCKKDDGDTSGGTPINLVKKLEFFIDGTEWESDEVTMETLYGGMQIVGKDGDKRLIFDLAEFNGAGTYVIDNQQNTVQYFEDATNIGDFYYAVGDSITIASYNDAATYLTGNFAFEGIHSQGGNSKSFTAGMFNGVDSLLNVSSDILEFSIDDVPWHAKSIEVLQNATTNTLSTLAISSTDNTYMVLRIPLNTVVGVHELNNPDFILEYQQVDNSTFSANSGQLTITENNTSTKVLSGHFENVTTVNTISGGSVVLNGSFHFQYN